MLFCKVFGFKRNSSCYAVLAASETQLFVNLKMNKIYIFLFIFKLQYLEKNTHQPWLDFIPRSSTMLNWNLEISMREKGTQRKSFEARWELKKTTVLNWKPDILSTLALLQSKAEGCVYNVTCKLLGKQTVAENT